jgi:hypothetical protein
LEIIDEETGFLGNVGPSYFPQQSVEWLGSRRINYRNLASSL